MSATSIKAQFRKEGISIRQWAKARGYKPRAVYAVLNGKLKGDRGRAHQIAVELGIKKEPSVLRFRRVDPAA